MNRIVAAFTIGFLLALTACSAARAQCPHRPLALWEIFSNADGSVQFLVLVTVVEGEGDGPPLTGRTLVSSSGAQENAYRFPSDLPSRKNGQFILVGTQGFADLDLIKPDFVVPNGFVFVQNGSVKMANEGWCGGPVQYSEVPINGRDAYYPDSFGDSGVWIGAALPVNFARESYSFGRTIDAGITGSWYDSAQSGHGFMLEVLPGNPMRLLVGWFTFAPQGGQAWIIGVGPITDYGAEVQAYESAGSGGRFPPNFDAANVHQQDWGTLTFTFRDCNHGHVQWASIAPGYGSGAMDLSRLTLPEGLTCDVPSFGQ